MEKQQSLGVAVIFFLANLTSGLVEAAVLAAAGTTASTLVTIFVKWLINVIKTKRKPPGKQ